MAPRHRQSDAELAAEQLYGFLTAVPFWVGPLVAALGYSLFRFLIPAFCSDSEQPGATLAAMSRMVAPFVGGLALLIWVGAEIKKFFTRRLFDACANASSVRALDWREFESLIGEAFRRQGYAVSETPAGPDGGVDLILTKDGGRTLVQCKHWKSWKVGVETIRALYGVVAADGAVGGIVVCCGQYTAAARRFAENLPLRLIDGPALLRMIADVKGDAGVRSGQPEQVRPGAIPSPPPACPQCQSPMVLRMAKQGPNAGSRFYGCSRFPACRVTRPAEPNESLRRYSP